jgi:hypothetical protein
MNEVLSFYSEDALKYGEEAASVLYVIRFAINMHQRGRHLEEFVKFDGIPHLELSNAYIEGYFSYKSTIALQRILKRLKKLNVISIKEGNYYAVID